MADGRLLLQRGDERREHGLVVVAEGHELGQDRGLVHAAADMAADGFGQVVQGVPLDGGLTPGEPGAQRLATDGLPIYPARRFAAQIDVDVLVTLVTAAEFVT